MSDSELTHVPKEPCLVILHFRRSDNPGDPKSLLSFESVNLSGYILCAFEVKLG